MQGLWWQAQAGELTDLPGMSKVLRDQTQQYGNELLQLAAKQRMNTDVRRAIFCIIMGSEDYADASERLLKLPLKVNTIYFEVKIFFEFYARRYIVWKVLESWTHFKGQHMEISSYHI